MRAFHNFFSISGISDVNFNLLISKFNASGINFSHHFDLYTKTQQKKAGRRK